MHDLGFFVGRRDIIYPAQSTQINFIERTVAQSISMNRIAKFNQSGTYDNFFCHHIFFALRYIYLHCQ